MCPGVTLAMLASDPLGRFVDAALGLVVEHEVVPPVGMSGAVAEGVVDGVAERYFDESEVGHPGGGDAAVPPVEAQGSFFVTIRCADVGREAGGGEGCDPCCTHVGG